MSELAAFLKGRGEKKNVKYAACAEWKDEKGNPIKWELKSLSSAEMARIRSRCMDLSNGKKMKFDGELYNRLITSASVVYPDLKEAALADLLMPNAPLEDRKPENLICLILRDDDEYQALIAKVTEVNGWDKKDKPKDLIETAKN